MVDIFNFAYIGIAGDLLVKKGHRILKHIDNVERVDDSHFRIIGIPPIRDACREAHKIIAITTNNEYLLIDDNNPYGKVLTMIDILSVKRIFISHHFGSQPSFYILDSTNTLRSITINDSSVTVKLDVEPIDNVKRVITHLSGMLLVTESGVIIHDGLNNTFRVEDSIGRIENIFDGLILNSEGYLYSYEMHRGTLFTHKLFMPNYKVDDCIGFNKYAYTLSGGRLRVIHLNSHTSEREVEIELNGLKLVRFLTIDYLPCAEDVDGNIYQLTERVDNYLKPLNFPIILRNSNLVERPRMKSARPVLAHYDR